MKIELDAKQTLLAALIHVGENFLRLASEHPKAPPTDEIAGQLAEMAKKLPDGWRDDEDAQIFAEKCIQAAETHGQILAPDNATAEDLLLLAQSKVLEIAAARLKKVNQ